MHMCGHERRPHDPIHVKYISKHGFKVVIKMLDATLMFHLQDVMLQAQCSYTGFCTMA